VLWDKTTRSFQGPDVGSFCAIITAYDFVKNGNVGGRTGIAFVADLLVRLNHDGFKQKPHASPEIDEKMPIARIESGKQFGTAEA
jgi:hypothetical protein